MTKKLKLFGNLLAGVALIYVALQIWGNRYELKAVIQGNVIFVTVFMAILFAGMVCFNPWIFCKILNIVSSSEIKYIVVAPLYTKANLYKYLPGNVMHYVGRNQIAIETELTHGEVAFASILEIIITVFAAFLGGLLLASNYLIDALMERVSLEFIATIFIIFLCFFAVVVFFMRKKIKLILNRINSVLTWKNVKQLMMITILILCYMIVNGMIFSGVLCSLNIPLNFQQFFEVTGISIVAWLIGFITLGAPGGLGVREAMLSVLLSNMVPTGVLAAAALLYRVITILGDILGYLFIKIFVTNRGRL